MDLTPAELRHATRGAFNALKLCVSAFEMPLEPSEKLEFLSDIDNAAQRIINLLADLDANAAGQPEVPVPGAVDLSGVAADAHVR